MAKTHYEALERNVVYLRDFLKFCSIMAAWLGLAPAMPHALETKPRLPAIWIGGLSCSCCTESFIRTSNPLAGDIILDMISLDYNDVLMTASGEQANAAFGVSCPIESGHSCMGCAEQGYFDNGSFYERVAGVPLLDNMTTAENLAAATAGIIGAGIAIHAAASVAFHLRERKKKSVESAPGIKIPDNANIIRSIIALSLWYRDHLVNFYQLSGLDWIDIVSASSADPAWASAIAQKRNNGSFRQRARLRTAAARGRSFTALWKAQGAC